MFKYFAQHKKAPADVQKPACRRYEEKNKLQQKTFY